MLQSVISWGHIREIFLSFFFALKVKFQVIKFEFCQITLSCDRITDNLAINWQKFAQVGLQLKFGLSTRPIDSRNSNLDFIRSS